MLHHEQAKDDNSDPVRQQTVGQIPTLTPTVPSKHLHFLPKVVRGTSRKSSLTFVVPENVYRGGKGKGGHERFHPPCTEDSILQFQQPQKQAPGGAEHSLNCHARDPLGTGNVVGGTDLCVVRYSMATVGIVFTKNPRAKLWDRKILESNKSTFHGHGEQLVPHKGNTGKMSCVKGPPCLQIPNSEASFISAKTSRTERPTPPRCAVVRMAVRPRAGSSGSESEGVRCATLDSWCTSPLSPVGLQRTVEVPPGTWTCLPLGPP